MEKDKPKAEPIEIEKGRLYWISDSQAPKCKTSKASYFCIDNNLEYEPFYEDFGPFLDAIDKNMDMIMVGHISAPNIIGDNTPSSLSKLMVTDILRDRLSYDGVIITDAMNMPAISKNYTVEQSTVEAIKAGCDIVLMPSDFRRAYASVLKAVNNKEITEKQIDESVRRILILKKRRLSF